MCDEDVVLATCVTPSEISGLEVSTDNIAQSIGDLRARFGEHIRENDAKNEVLEDYCETIRFGGC